MRIWLVRLMLLIGIFSLVNGTASAQTCPVGQPKTAFVWMNGILVPDRATWEDSVAQIRNNFLVTHPSINPNCVKFDAMYNQSAWLLSDLTQSVGQLVATALGRINFNDPNFIELLDKIGGYAVQGYKVVLVGHSQGSLYTNIAYNSIKNDEAQIYVPTITRLPDESKLSVVNIATPASYVADGRQKYTTQCGDIILSVPGNLPANVNNTIVPCSIAVPPLWLAHELDAYLSTGLNSQKQIYEHLEDSLPDPGCGTDVNCYLNDNFSGNDYTTNFTQLVAQSSTIQETSGALWLNSTGTSAHLGVRSRRVFTGPFTASFQYDSLYTGTNLTLADASNNIVVAGIQTVTNGTHTLTFTKTDTQINVYGDGNLRQSVASTPDSGYYLYFDLQGQNNLQIKNLSVVRGVFSPTMTLTPATNAVSVVQGGSKSLDLVLASQNGMNGNATLPMYCMQACPGVSASRPATAMLPSNGSVALHTVFYTSTATPVGVYNLEYWAVLNGVTKKATITLTVTALVATTPTMTLTPATSAVSVVQGNSGSVDVTLASQNGMTGTGTGQMYCSITCPAGVTASWPSMVSLPANGSVSIHLTINTSTATPVGVYSFEFWAVINGLTKKAIITLTVTVPTLSTSTMIWTPATNVMSVVQESSKYIDLVLSSQGGMMGAASLMLYCYQSTCPTGITYNYTYPSVSLPANGSVSARVTFFTTTIAAGTYNYEYRATLGGVTKSAMIALTVNLNSPTPSLSYLTVNTQPKVNLNINVTLYGSGFVPGMQAFVCTTTSTSSCSSTAYNLNSYTQVTLPSVRSSTARTLYIRVVNSAGVWSNYLTMVVIN